MLDPYNTYRECHNLSRSPCCTEEQRLLNQLVQLICDVVKHFQEGLKKRMYQIFTSTYHLMHTGLASLLLILSIFQLITLQTIFYFSKTSELLQVSGGEILIYVSKSYKTFCFPQHPMKICYLSFRVDSSLLNLFLFIIWQFVK